MAAANGIFLLAELEGEAGERIHAIQRRFDPKLAGRGRPHVTLAGSSGVGPLSPDVPVARLREALAPIAATTPPLVLPFHAPERFPQTTIVVLPLDPYGPMRVLHDRIAASGLPFAQAKFTFTPHVTLNFFRTQDAAGWRALLDERMTAPAEIRTVRAYHTRDPQPAKLLLELALEG
jgi:2'-5' RNA ligase